MESINSYMRWQAFGDYSRADHATREEMETLALEYAAREQASRSILGDLEARRVRERYDADQATAADIIALRSTEEITQPEAVAYYERHGWTEPKYGIR